MTIPNKLIFATTTVLLGVLGQKLNVTYKEQYPPTWLEAKINPTQREFSQQSELERGKPI